MVYGLKNEEYDIWSAPLHELENTGLSYRGEMTGYRSTACIYICQGLTD